MPIKLSRAKVGFSHLVFSFFFFLVSCSNQKLFTKETLFSFTHTAHGGLNRFSVVLHKRIVKLFSNVLFRVNTLWEKKEWPVKLPVALLNQQD